MTMIEPPKNKLAETSRFLLYSSLFLVPFYFLRFSHSFIKTNIFEIVLFAALAVFLLNNRQNFREMKFGSLWALLFLISAIIVCLYSPDKVKALGILKSWFIVPYILYFLIINQFTSRDLPRLAIPLTASAVLIIIWGLLQLTGFHYYLPNQSDADLQNFLVGSAKRIFSVFESPNYLAMYLAPLIFVSALLIDKLKKSKLIFLLGTVIILGIVTLYLTNSRSGLIAALAGLLYLLTRLIMRKRTFVRYVTMSFIVILAVNLTYSIVKFNHLNSEVGREKIYSYSVQVIEHHKMFGVGLGEFPTALADEAKNDREFLVYFLPNAYHPHNLYMEIWLNLGLLGLITFIIFIAKFFYNLSENNDSLPSLLIFCAMISILVQGIFDTTYFKSDLAAIFWFLCAAAYLLRSQKTKEIWGGRIIL